MQYRDSSKLVARARLHARYGTASERWFPWRARQIDWPAAARVLEVGCGSGVLWVECGERVPIPYPDELRGTDPADMLVFLRSTPPAEDAPPGQWGAVVAEVSAAFADGHGAMRVTKDTGLFVCRVP